MPYRTKTYIAADWTGDKDAIDQLYKWNKSEYWELHFTDAHELTQARDSSLNCNIKKSLKERLDASKKFILKLVIEHALLQAAAVNIVSTILLYISIV